MEALAETLDLEQLYEFVTALRGGNFSVRLKADLSGRAGEIALNLNRFAQQMEAFTSEITRVCLEIAVQGKLGPQAELFLPPGPWRNCIEAVNVMAYEITSQIRDMNKTAQHMARGDFKRKVTVSCQGETQELKNAMNAAIDQLARK